MKINSLALSVGSLDQKIEVILESIEFFLKNSKYTINRDEAVAALVASLPECGDLLPSSKIVGKVGDIISFEISVCDPFSSSGPFIDYVIERFDEKSSARRHLSIGIESGDYSYDIYSGRMIPR